MIFDLIKHAKQLLFDDSTAKTGASNVQGAIEALKTKHDTDLKYCSKYVYLDKTPVPIPKKGGTYTFPSGAGQDLKSVLGQGTFFISLYNVNTAWRYAGIVTVGSVGAPVLTPIVESSNLVVTLTSSTSGSTTTYGLQCENTNTGYDLDLKLTATKLSLL